MKQGFMRFLGGVNVLLAFALVGGAFWLYGREHETRQVERQIQTLQRATALEEETIRRLEIEWQRLRNPLRLEPLARLKLNLMPPDPLVVMPRAQALVMLPLRPPPVEGEVGGADADVLADMAAQAAQEPAAAAGAERMEPAESAAMPGVGAATDEAVAGSDPPASAPAARPAAAGDALGNLINGIMQDGGGQP